MNAQTKVRRPRWIILMAFASLVLMLSAASTARPPMVVDNLYARVPADGLTKHFTGQIAEVRAETIMVVDAVGEDHAFSVSDDTTIMLNETEASLDMLHAGLLATVRAESHGDEWIAMSVHATQQY